MFRKHICIFRAFGGQTPWQGVAFYHREMFEFLDSGGKRHWGMPEEYLESIKTTRLPFYQWLKDNKIDHALVWEPVNKAATSITDLHIKTFDLFFEVTDPNQAMLARLIWG